jgi:hypothetical protein
MVRKVGATQLVVFSLMLFSSIVLLHAQGGTGSTPPSAKATVDVTGTWTGTFQSNTSSSSFTMTVVIERDPQGILVGTASLNSNCFNDSKLQVTATGAKVVLAGSDAAGNSLTIRGTLDATGTLMKLHYITNGSASGRCESDRGIGNMSKH